MTIGRVPYRVGAHPQWHQGCPWWCAHVNGHSHASWCMWGWGLPWLTVGWGQCPCRQGSCHTNCSLQDKGEAVSRRKRSQQRGTGQVGLARGRGARDKLFMVSQLGTLRCAPAPACADVTGHEARGGRETIQSVARSEGHSDVPRRLRAAQQVGTARCQAARGRGRATSPRLAGHARPLRIWPESRMHPALPGEEDAATG